MPRAGALDAPAAALANRLVGNTVSAAVLEVTFGGLEVRAAVGRWVAVTGAPCSVSIDGLARSHDRAEWLAAGATLRLGAPRTGVRSSVAVSGGIAVEPVLGSRSTDTLAWVGPPRAEAGMDLTGVRGRCGLRTGELASEGMVLGAVQVPPSGRPVVFLADHPPTGGYPVIGVVHEEDLWQCAQRRPGEQVRFTRAPRAARD